MKNILKKMLFISLSIVLVLSCTTNDYEEPENTTAGRAIGINSFDKARKGETVDVRIGTSVVEFTDLSILASGRTWTFTEGTVDILGSDNDTTTNLKKFSVTFKKVGPVEVLLAPVFNGPIPDEVATETFTFNALEQITANIGTDLTLVNGAFEVEAGTDVTFTNNSSEKDNSEWRVINTTTGKEEDLITTTNLVFPFKVLGNYVVALRAFDEQPFSESIVAIPVRVIPSSIPLQVKADEVIELVDETIQVPFNQNITSFAGQETAFTVTVNGTPFTINSIALNADDPSIVEIKLNDPIYRPDVITVSYNGTGTLESNGNSAEIFTDVPVMTNRDNLFDKVAYDFEDGGAGWALDPVNTAIVTFTDEKASSGTTSMKIDNSTAGTSNFRVTSANAPFDLVPGIYEVSFDLFLEDGNTWGATVPTMNPLNLQRWTDARPAAVTRGEWVTITREYEITSDQTGINMLLRSEGGGGVAFVDNWQMVLKEVRP